jgi:hypothetical protein
MAEAVRTTFTPSASPAQKQFGHIVATLLGVLSIIGGFASLAKGLPPVMGATMLVVGALLPVLVWKSWNYSRGAWSFLISIISVFAAVMFFGAPKIAHVLGIDIVTALAFPALEIACVVSLASLRRDYRV